MISSSSSVKKIEQRRREKTELAGGINGDKLRERQDQGLL